METTVGKVLLKEHLPESMHAYIDSTELDKKGISTLFNTLAEKHPNDYGKYVSGLGRLGFEVSTRMGSSIKLSDLKSPIDKKAKFEELDKKLDALRLAEKDPKKYLAKANDIYQAFIKEVTKELVDVGVANNQTLAKIIRSGSRGSPVQYMQTVFSPVLVQNNRGEPMVDFPLKKSFAEGLTLPEYMASAFGSRHGEVSKKLATADAGFFSKELSRAAMTLRIVEHDCGTDNGIDNPVADREAVGTFLAHPIGGYHKNNEVTTKMLNDLANKGIHSIVVRSPITCQSSRKFHNNGICQLCAGRREKGLPSVGEYVGITSGQTLGEPLCVAEGTLVRMADFSVKAIETISVGDWVMGADMEGKMFPVKVSNVFNNGIKSCVKTTVKLGRGEKSEHTSLVSTTEHRILTTDSKRSRVPTLRSVGELGLELQTVAIPRLRVKLASGLKEHSNLRTEPFALLLGVLIGDGCYTGNAIDGILLSCYDKTQMDALNPILASLGVRAVPQATPGEYRISDNTSTFMKVCANGVKTRNVVKQFLINEGLWGQYSYNKIIPKSVITWDNPSVALLISGLIATDGWITLPTVLGFSSTSEELVYQLKELLALRFGVYAGRVGRKQKRKTSTEFYKPSFEMNVCNRADIAKLAAVLNIPGVKQSKLQGAANVKKDCVMPAGEFSVVCVEPCGNFNTYDLEVDSESHLYVLANQMVIHNSQGQLSLKHSSGSAAGPSLASGFNLIEQLATIPQTFKDKAAVAEHDGVVSKIRPAPQGGNYLDIGSAEYYIPTGFGLKVKVGDTVEAGDVLSDGVVNPADMVRLKGIGEGRRYFSHALKKAFDDSGMGGINRRNFELLSKGLIDHVRITNNEGLGDHLPGEIVSYQSIEKEYQPRSDSLHTRVDQAYNKYIEQPILHYTIGTRVTRKMIEQLKKHHIESIHVSSHPPAFTPEMQRLNAIPAHESDWMHQLYTTNLERKLLHAVNTGAFSDTKGPSPVPGLAYALGFGEK